MPITSSSRVVVDDAGVSREEKRAQIIEQQRTNIFTLLEVMIAAVGCASVDKIFHNPYCGVLFRCHCTWPWMGGSAHCNIHGTGPKCPWCNVKNTPLRWLSWAITDGPTIALMFCAYCGCWALQHRARHRISLVPLLAETEKGDRDACRRTVQRISVRALAAVLTFLLVGLVLGLVFFLGTDYPCFLWIAPLGPNGTRCGFPI